MPSAINVFLLGINLMYWFLLIHGGEETVRSDLFLQLG